MLSKTATNDPGGLLVAIVIIVATLGSSWYVYHNVTARAPNTSMQFQQDILSGDASEPYKYRVLVPLVGRALEIVVSPLFDSSLIRHNVAYATMGFATFLGIYLLLYLFLRALFVARTAVIGLMFFQLAVPLSVTGVFMVGDYVTVLFYLIGLNLMLSGRHAYLPVVVGLGTLNRQQMIFLVVFYAIYLYSQNLTRQRAKLLVLVSCIASFMLVFVGLRTYLGVEPGLFINSFKEHFAFNTDLGNLRKLIIPLWLIEVAPLAAMCLFVFKKSNRFLRLSFLSLGIYTLLFFFNGKLWEFAKYLPALLIMIPMSLQFLTGRFVPDTMVRRPSDG